MKWKQILIRERKEKTIGSSKAGLSVGYILFLAGDVGMIRRKESFREVWLSD